jgi:hypothetical protein
VVELAHDQVVGVPLDGVVCLVKDQKVDLAHLQINESIGFWATLID